MISYAICSALESGAFSRVLVSTDDKEIADTALAYGAEVPFLRPAELSDDHTPTVPVIRHAIAHLEANLTGEKSDPIFICCMYPTVPLLELSDIHKALDLVKESPIACYSFPVANFPSAIKRALTLDPSGRLRSIQPENELVRSQDLEPAFFDAGQFYWAHLATWKENARVQSAALGLPIPLWRVVDIDTPEDWGRAELIYSALRRIVSSD